MRALFGGKNTVRLSMLDEKRGANYVTPNNASANKSKVCGIM